jgi:GntR family transcriptional regulator
MRSPRTLRSGTVTTSDHLLSYDREVADPAGRRGSGAAGATLDRTSFVPLYYQLQEVLKEQIESGIWAPGEALPSEPALARRFGVSRVVVRQALAILQDDRQIVRVKGRGTFVAEPKVDARAGGLSRLLVAPRPPDAAIATLDVSPVRVEDSILRELGAGPADEVLRITTLLSLHGVPVSISYSFFRREEVGWLEAAIRPGRNLPADLVLGAHGIELAHSRIAIETSQCGQFEADRFGIPHRASVFLAVCTEFRRDGDDTRPFEVARAEYRGDILRFRLEVSPARPGAMEAVWELTEPDAVAPAARR